MQLRSYLNIVNQKTNPFEVWKSSQDEFCHVWSVAKKVLSITATSVPCERLFSHAGLIANQLRSRLSPQHLNMLVFLRSVNENMWFPKN